MQYPLVLAATAADNAEVLHEAMLCRTEVELTIMLLSDDNEGDCVIMAVVVIGPLDVAGPPTPLLWFMVAVYGLAGYDCCRWYDWYG